jgi:hypothetical protein
VRPRRQVRPLSFAAHKGRSLLSACILHRRKSDGNISYIRYARLWLLLALDGGFPWYWRQQIGLGDHSTRPSQRAIHTRCTTSVPSHLLEMITTGDDKTIKIWTTFRKMASKSSRDTHITSPSIMLSGLECGTVKTWHAVHKHGTPAYIIGQVSGEFNWSSVPGAVGASPPRSV